VSRNARCSLLRLWKWTGLRGLISSCHSFITHAARARDPRGTAKWHEVQSLKRYRRGQLNPETELAILAAKAKRLRLELQEMVTRRRRSDVIPATSGSHLPSRRKRR
jgi:hypothetical protein